MKLYATVKRSGISEANNFCPHNMWIALIWIDFLPHLPYNKLIG